MRGTRKVTPFIPSRPTRSPVKDNVSSAMNTVPLTGDAELPTCRESKPPRPDKRKANTRATTPTMIRVVAEAPTMAIITNNKIAPAKMLAQSRRLAPVVCSSCQSAASDCVRIEPGEDATPSSAGVGPDDAEHLLRLSIMYIVRL